MSEQDIVLLIFIAIGLYLLWVGEIKVMLSFGPAGINRFVKPGSTQQEIKTKGFKVRVLGLFISAIAIIVYVYR